MNSEYDGLPDHVKPSHYALSLFDLTFHEPWTYQGIVTIGIAVRSSTRTIAVNTNELRVKSAQIVLGGNDPSAPPLQANDISYDERNQRCILTFDQPLPASNENEYDLSISFEGVMNDHLTGFYRSSYRPPQGAESNSPCIEGEHYMFSTQFQPIDARRAFPCFDEPGLKATFDFRIEIPKALATISNMPHRSIEPCKKAGFNVVSFDRTPRMSTYLLAWTVGDFEYIEHVSTRSSGQTLPIRVYTTKGLGQHAKFGLEIAEKTVKYFSEIFHVDYPLPKLDMLVVHEMPDDAMENWGLLTFLPTAMLFDPETSDPEYQSYVAYIVAHELAHQWFGNLVTMKWWDELWLNEGFATWAGWQAVDHLHPEWDVWAKFVGDSMQGAFDLDSLHASHPVQVEVHDAREVDAIFDAISYQKGSSLIRMLAAYLGEASFLKGVADYLNAHAYGSTKGGDLWHALSASSGQDVASFMQAWIEQKGFPVIMVQESEAGLLDIRQQRFLRSDAPTAEQDTTTWWIPIQPRNASVSRARPAQTLQLTTKETTLTLSDADLLTLNAHATGFYRLSLSPQLLERLSFRLDDLSIQERIALIGDLAALVAAGHAHTTTATLLSYLRHFRSQTNVHVWKAVLGSLEYVQSIFSSDPEVASALHKYTLDLISPLLSKLGANFFETASTSSTPRLTIASDLRSLLISTAGLAGHLAIVTEARSRVNRYLTGEESALSPSLRKPALEITVRHSTDPASTSAQFQREYFRTTSIDGKESLMWSLGQTPSSSAAYALLSTAFQPSPARPNNNNNNPSDKIETPHIQPIADGLANNTNPHIRRAAWEFIRENWPAIYSKLAGSIVLLDRFLQAALETLVEENDREEIRVFFENVDTTGFGRGLGVALEKIHGNAAYARRDGDVLCKWLRQEGYLN